MSVALVLYRSHLNKQGRMTSSVTPNVARLCGRKSSFSSLLVPPRLAPRGRVVDGGMVAASASRIIRYLGWVACGTFIKLTSRPAGSPKPET